MNTAGNPMQVITGKLDNIIKMLDGLNTGDSSSDSTDIVQIKKDISKIAKSMTALASSVETEDVRKEKQDSMVEAIVEGVNGKIGTLQESMKDFNVKVSETQFTASLPQDQARSVQELAQALAPEAQTKLGWELKKYAGQLNEVATKVGKENLKKTLEDSSKEWVKNYKETLKKDVEDAYTEVEKKRKQEGKVIVMKTSTFYVLLIITIYSICLGFWGMAKVVDFETLKWVLIAILVCGLFMGCISSWMKLKEWMDNRKWGL